MSKKDNQSDNNAASFGEISTIRDILMGQHINEFEAKFESLQKKLSDVESKLSQKIKDVAADAKSQRKDLSKETDNQFARLEEHTDSRFAQLEQSVSDGLANLQQMMEESNLNDKERIGQLLMEAGKKLLKS